MSARYEELIVNNMTNIQLAEDILRYVEKHKIVHLLDINDEFAVNGNNDSSEVKIAVAELLDARYLILMQNREHCAILSDKGRLALSVGIVEYGQQEKRKVRQLKYDSFKRELAIGVICTIVGSLLTFLISC